MFSKRMVRFCCAQSLISDKTNDQDTYLCLKLLTVPGLNKYKSIPLLVRVMISKHSVAPDLGLSE